MPTARRPHVDRAVLAGIAGAGCGGAARGLARGRRTCRARRPARRRGWHHLRKLSRRRTRMATPWRRLVRRQRSTARRAGPRQSRPSCRRGHSCGQRHLGRHAAGEPLAGRRPPLGRRAVACARQRRCDPLPQPRGHGRCRPPRAHIGLRRRQPRAARAKRRYAPRLLHRARARPDADTDGFGARGQRLAIRAARGQAGPQAAARATHARRGAQPRARDDRPVRVGRARRPAHRAGAAGPGGGLPGRPRHRARPASAVRRRF